MKRANRVALLAAALAIPAGLFAATLYETGFEQSGDPSGFSFQLGSLDGQGGWTATPPESAVVTDVAGAQSGAQFVQQDIGSSIDLALDGAGVDSVFIEAYHKGSGTADPQMPADSPLASAVVAFKSTGANTYTIYCLDGDGTGNAGAAWTQALPSVDFNVADWAHIVLRVDYQAQAWDCIVNGHTYMHGLGFRDSGVSQFNGFKSTTEVGADLDTFSVVGSDGDLDDDGFDDQVEIENDSDPTSSASTPTFGDVDGNGVVNTLDALIQYRLFLGLISDPGGLYTTYDINQDGAITERDAELLYLFAIGDPTVPTLPVRS